MGEDEPSNLIAFPGKPDGDATPAPSRHHDLIRRLETIATTIGVPVATFLGTVQGQTDPKHGPNGSAAHAQTTELLQLFERIGDGQTRDQCLGLLRMLAAGGAEPSR